MRQYKIKQRYLDKILHGMNVESCHDVPKDSVFFSGPDRMPQFPGAEEILASDQLEPLALGLMGQEDNMPMCDGLSMGKTVEDYETSDDISISTYHSFGVEDPDEIPPLIPAEVVPWLRGGSRAGSRRSRSAPSPQPTSSALEIEICSGEDTISPNNSSSRLLEKESNC